MACAVQEMEGTEMERGTGAAKTMGKKLHEQLGVQPSPGLHPSVAHT